MLPQRFRQLMRAAARVACVALLALPLAALPAVAAAAKHHKGQIKPKHAAKKYKPAAAKHPKVKKAKPVARKPAARNIRSVAAPQAAKVYAARKTGATDKPKAFVADTPQALVTGKWRAAAEADDSPAFRSARTVCRRGDRIYLLADCNTAELPAALAAGPADAEPRRQ